LSRIFLAFRSFFAILFGGSLPPDVASKLGYARSEVKKAAAPAKERTPADGALQLAGILQREARLIDFLTEDISAYTDDQVGAAVRGLHKQCAEALQRHVRLAPVIDGVEGTYTNTTAAGELAKDAAAIKFVGKVPPDGRAAGGILRHKGWRAEKVELPRILGGQNVAVLAPAEIEVE